MREVTLWLVFLTLAISPTNGYGGTVANDLVEHIRSPPGAGAARAARRFAKNMIMLLPASPAEGFQPTRAATQSLSGQPCSVHLSMVTRAAILEKQSRTTFIDRMPPARHAHVALKLITERSSDKQGTEFFTLDMCPYAQRVWIVLEELGVPYERIEVNLRDTEQRAAYELHVNPRGKVPALRDEDVSLFESLIVCEYLASKHGSTSLMPSSDAALASRIRMWSEHLDSELAPAHFTLLMNKDEATQANKTAALDRALDHYEQNLIGPYLCGPDFSLADAAALPFFERLVFSLRHFRQLEPLSRYPRTMEWLRTAMARPSFQTTKRPEDKLVALYERFLAVDYSFGGLNKNS